MKLTQSSIRCGARPPILVVLSMLLVGCATVSVSPEGAIPANPISSMNAIEAEPTMPSKIAVRDFDFDPSAVTENRSPINRTTDLARDLFHSSSRIRQVAIGRDAGATLSKAAAKRLDKIGLQASRVPGDYDLSPSGNYLLVTGSMVDVDEGNRLTRVALGLGLGESRLVTEVHVYRITNGERAEVLTFMTHADSGKMPGVAPGIGFGELMLGPITFIAAIEDALSSGQKIYASQIEYLSAETGDQVARYLSQYSASEGWIPKNKAESVHLAG